MRISLDHPSYPHLHKKNYLSSWCSELPPPPRKILETLQARPREPLWRDARDTRVRQDGHAPKIIMGILLWIAKETVVEVMLVEFLRCPVDQLPRPKEITVKSRRKVIANVGRGGQRGSCTRRLRKQSLTLCRP